MNARARIERVEREAWKRNLAGQVRRVHYVIRYAQEPGKTGPPEIFGEFDMYERIPPGAEALARETKKPNEN